MVVLHVFDKNFERKATINSYISLVWQEQYQNKGGFLLYMDDSSSNVAEIGDYLFISGGNTAMIILYKEIKSDQQQVMFGGQTTLYLLSKRINRNTVKISNAESGMLQIVSQNIRGHQRLSVALPKGLTEMHESERTGGEALDTLIEIAAATGLGIRMRFDRVSKGHVFEVYKGLDRRITQNANSLAFFGDDFKNVYSIQIGDDISHFKNVAYVRGAGEGAQRVVVEIGNASNENRYEMDIDARDLQPSEDSGETLSSPSYLARLRSRGQERLSEYVRRQNFIVDVDSRDFGIKYNLGDLVSCKSTRYQMLLHARIIEYTLLIEGNNQKTNISVGEAKIDVLNW